MGNCPMHHTRLTSAANLVSNACAELAEASYDDSSYTPLLEAARRLHKKLFARWEKNCKVGKKEGWFK